MARTEATKRAQAKYEEQIRRITIKLRQDRDGAIISHLESVDNVQAYIKRLIREDMYRHDEEPEKEYGIYKATAEIKEKPDIKETCTYHDPNPELVETVGSKEEALLKVREMKSSVESFTGHGGRTVYAVTEFYAAENGAPIEYSAF